MDGTLVDTEQYWLIAEVELVESFGGTWTVEQANELVGTSLWLSADALRAGGVPWEAERIIDALTDRVMQRVRQDVPWRPGAKELLAALRAAGVPTGLVTMSIRRMAEEIAEAASAALGVPAFDVIVSLSDVENPKPHPEPYLDALRLLGVDAADAVAIEDSRPGLASAIASGVHAVGVPHLQELPETPGAVLWQTLHGRTPADLGALLDGEARP